MATPTRPTAFSLVFSADRSSVVLYDWWLVKADVDFEGRRLAVGGFVDEGSRAPGSFTSAPIVHRYDAHSLKTADGVTVIIRGVINSVFTQKNGFPSVACSDFLIGFPCSWKFCASQYFENETPPAKSDWDTCKIEEDCKLSEIPKATLDLTFGPLTSTLKRIVVLYDWWLLKVEANDGTKRLGIGGSASKGKGASRIFTSAAIIRRFDAYTLETADSITVMIEGIINEVSTKRNGFSSEVCRDFLTGFPFTWNSCCDKYLGHVDSSIKNVADKKENDSSSVATEHRMHGQDNIHKSFATSD